MNELENDGINKFVQIIMPIQSLYHQVIHSFIVLILNINIFFI